jgi:hypothetical protein
MLHRHSLRCGNVQALTPPEFAARVSAQQQWRSGE